MIAIRTYWNPAEAALGKTLLDNYEVACALFHENANLYGRAPMAMPIRLVVREDQADWAAVQEKLLPWRSPIFLAGSRLCLPWFYLFCFSVAGVRHFRILPIRLVEA